MAKRTSRIKAASTTLLRSMRQRPTSTRDQLQAAVNHHDVKLDEVIRYLADHHGYGTLSTFDPAVNKYTRKLIRTGPDVQERDMQRADRTFAELCRNVRVAQTTSARRPNDQPLRKAAEQLKVEAIDLGVNKLGMSVTDVLTLVAA
jgi:hypothetical protein